MIPASEMWNFVDTKMMELETYECDLARKIEYVGLCVRDNGTGPF